ncbi:MAG: hypothetical protein IKD69_11745 [Solobacterium sp.]|nr:hypothetical protein [Solobacterium sp.]
MTSMRSLLEKDEERFLQNAGGAANAQDMIRVAGDELSRILYAYNEEEKEDDLKELAYDEVQTLKASLGFLDTADEAKVWKKNAVKAEAKMPLLGWLCAGGAVVVMVLALFSASGLSAQSLVLLILSLALAFFAGTRRVKGGEEGETMTEIVISPKKAYRVLQAAMTVIDHNLEEHDQKLTRERKAVLEEAGGPLSKEEISLFTDLLEELYASRTDESKAILSRVRFYLHQRAVELEDYTGDNRRYFDILPGSEKATVRPALVFDKTLVKKGVASGGR